MIVYVLVVQPQEREAVGGIWGVFTDEEYLEEAEGVIKNYYRLAQDEENGEVEFEHLQFELNVVREN